MNFRRTPLYLIGAILLFLGGCFQNNSPTQPQNSPQLEDAPTLEPMITPNPPSRQVGFTLEGCRNDGTITLPNGAGKFICPDPAPLGGPNSSYTTGNLGKGWNELDLVPHRLITGAGTQANATTDYSVIIAADNRLGTKIGYDVVSVPEVDAGFSHSSCTVVAGPQSIAPGVTGGVDDVIYRVVNIHQNKGTTCVFNYYQRLALGASAYSGSSLQSYMFEKDDFSTGKRTISIPVKDIIPQELNKDMAASQGADNVWNITKTPTPAIVSFGDVCQPESALPLEVSGVQIEIKWDIIAVNPGAIAVATNIYAKNPAARAVTVTVTDVIYEGTTQTTALDSKTSAPVVIPANTTQLVDTHVVNVPAGSAQVGAFLNDVATATYTDTVTNIPIPQTTTARAQAEITQGFISDALATITDSESITGTGLTFAVAQPALGNFSGYTANTFTTGPVDWALQNQSAGGLVTFDKTIRLNSRSITTGVLSDTAILNGSTNGFEAKAEAEINISSTATVSLTIRKKIPNILQDGESVTFTFHVKDANNNTNTNDVATPTITFGSGETDKTVTVTGLLPGVEYTVTEAVVKGFAPLEGFNQKVKINLPQCSGEVTFTNDFAEGALAKAEVNKVTQPAGSENGWEMTLAGPSGPETLTTADSDAAAFERFNFSLAEGNYTISETQQAGWDKTTEDGCAFTVNYPADFGKVFSCTITNVKQGKIIVEKQTDPDGSTQAFHFDASYDADGFDLTDGGSNDSGLLSASSVTNSNYSVSEVAMAGWDLTSATCTGDNNRSVQADTIDLQAGETVTCVFTNTLKRGNIIVKKVTIPAGSSQVFDFTASYGNFSLTDGDSNDSGPLLPFETYSVSETVPTGWDQVSATCNDGSKPNSIALDPGETVTCTFTNKQRGKIIVTKITKPTGAMTSFTFNTTGSDYGGFSLTDGQSNDSGFLKAGTYTVMELVPLGWVLTGIGGSSNPNTPYDCTVTGTTATSKGVGDLNTQTITITLKPGDTVNCVFENTGQGVTRTQGFWSTHSPLARIAWEGGTAFGHTFPGVAGVSGIGDTLICGRDVDASNITVASSNQLMGGFWSSISKTTTNATRSALDQARMQLLQQLLAAELNASAFGSVPSSGSFAAWETALCGTNVTTIKNAQQQAASFNTNGDSGTFTPGTSADSKNARNVADKVFWNIIKP